MLGFSEELAGGAADRAARLRRDPSRDDRLLVVGARVRVGAGALVDRVGTGRLLVDVLGRSTTRGAGAGVRMRLDVLGRAVVVVRLPRRMASYRALSDAWERRVDVVGDRPDVDGSDR